MQIDEAVEAQIVEKTMKIQETDALKIDTVNLTEKNRIEVAIETLETKIEHGIDVIETIEGITDAKKDRVETTDTTAIDAATETEKEREAGVEIEEDPDPHRGALDPDPEDRLKVLEGTGLATEWIDWIN